ncbi:MAG: 16S rRNA (adenine(1518)-N(6)/adenine(1519)-N(6))-dimethyltransferase RsmA [Planctomycetota bacterium]
MQTKRQIQELLSSAGVRPNKRLGQHFLIDKNLMRLLVEFADIQKDDVVLEVGCGTGSMTELLAERAGRTIAVELDRNLIEIAGRQLAEIETVELIKADILESKHTINHAITDALARARKEYEGRILLVANLPYHVASPVMLNLVTGPTIADAMYVTVQKEVAGRMTAPPASGDYGVLSIFLHAAGDVKTIRTLKPTVFWPQPQVDSAMVGFVRNRAKAARIVNMAVFSDIVHLFMGHRRKTLLACTRLAGGKLAAIANWAQVLEQCGIDPGLRPEKLSAEDYITLSNRAVKS